MTLRVLLTDADTILLSIYHAFLAKQRFLVRTASTALACVELLRHWRPDVLVLDSALLWGGGAGVLALVSEDSAVPTVLVLLLTTDPDAEENVPGFDHAVLRKPVPGLILVQAIRTLAHSRQTEGVGSERGAHVPVKSLPNDSTGVVDGRDALEVRPPEWLHDALRLAQHSTYCCGPTKTSEEFPGQRRSPENQSSEQSPEREAFTTQPGARKAHGSADILRMFYSGVAMAVLPVWLFSAGWRKMRWSGREMTRGQEGWTGLETAAAPDSVPSRVLGTISFFCLAWAWSLPRTETEQRIMDYPVRRIAHTMAAPD